MHPFRAVSVPTTGVVSIEQGRGEDTSLAEPHHQKRDHEQRGMVAYILVNIHENASIQTRASLHAVCQAMSLLTYTMSFVDVHFILTCLKNKILSSSCLDDLSIFKCEW